MSISEALSVKLRVSNIFHTQNHKHQSKEHKRLSKIQHLARIGLLSLSLLPLVTTSAAIKYELDAETQGRFPLQWFIGEQIIAPWQKYVLELNNIDTTDITYFEPPFKLDGFVGFSSSSHCGLDDELCNTGMMYIKRPKALSNRDRVMNQYAQDHGVVNPTKAIDFIYLLSHGEPPAKVVTEDSIRQEGNIFNAESAIFQIPGKMIAFQPLDCAGVVLIEPKTKTIVIIHGNRYVVKEKTFEKTFDKLIELGINVGDMIVWIPPTAHELLPSLQNDLINALTGKAPVLEANMIDIYMEQLTKFGIQPKNIFVTDIDTVRNTKTFSAHASAHFIDQDGNRLPLLDGINQIPLKSFANHILVVGFSN